MKRSELKGQQNRKSKRISGNGMKGLIYMPKWNALQQRPVYSYIALLGILIAVVGLIVFAAHWPALSASALLLDDDQYLVNNRLVQNPGWPSAGRFLTEVARPSTVQGYYQPLSMISLMMDYAVGGRTDNLMPFHRTSLALHLINTTLIIILLYLLFGQPWIAAMVGLLFGVHPMTVEAITWVGERKTLLAALFALLSLISYVLYTRKSERKYLWTSLSMYVLALMSKPTSMPLPVLMLLLDYWPVKRLNWAIQGENRKVILEKAPFFIIGFASAVITYFSQKLTASAALPGDGNSLLQILFIVCHDVVFYMYKILWPVNLSAHYSIPVPLGLSQPMVLAGVIGTCLLIAVLLVSLRRTRAVLAGWLFFFIGIFPTLGVIGFTNVIASDKYAYLPSIGFLMILAFFLSRLWSILLRIKVRTAGLAGLISIIIILSISESVGTRNYLAYWQDSEVMYNHMLSLAPQDYLLHNNLGTVLLERKKLVEAISHYNESIRIKPDSASVHNNLGLALADSGKPDEAILQYKEVIRLQPDYADAYFNLGTALAGQGKTEEAISQYKEAIGINPYHADAYYNMGNIFVREGKLEEAVICYRKVEEIEPYSADVHCSLGFASEGLGNFDEAAREFREALKIDPDLKDIQAELETVLINVKKEQNN